jgi:hypothetical protein
MHVALGYQWMSHHAAYHLERAFAAEGHDVTYVGLPAVERAGYDSRVDVDKLLARLAPRPDLFLWIDPAGPYFPRGIERLPLPTACYLIDVHLGGWREHAARFFDLVFVAQKDYVASYRQVVGHDQVYWLPLAAAPDVHYRHNLPPLYDVAFVGSVGVAHKRTNSRMRRLQLLAGRYHTNDVFAPTPVEEVGRIYSQARIVFNTSIAGDVTMRVFEGTASGALLVTDSVRNGLGELFEVGSELAVFGDDEEMLAKIDYYLAHEEERADIAAAGCRRTHRDHTYNRRVQQVVAAAAAKETRLLAPLRSQEEKIVRAERRAIYTSLHMLDALFDDARAEGLNPLNRGMAAAPALARRLLR